MSPKTTTTPIELNRQILFDRPNCLFVGRIVEVREKAIKVDYALEPISVYGCPAVTVFTRTCWIPISVLISDNHGIGFQVKKWFAYNFKGGNRIKNYFINQNSKPIFI